MMSFLAGLVFAVTPTNADLLYLLRTNDVIFEVVDANDNGKIEDLEFDRFKQAMRSDGGTDIANASRITGDRVRGRFLTPYDLFPEADYTLDPARRAGEDADNGDYMDGLPRNSGDGCNDVDFYQEYYVDCRDGRVYK